MESVQKEFYRKLQSKFQSSLKWDDLLPHGSTAVVGVSGGPDSMALLELIRQLSDEKGFRIMAAHLNHGIRGSESDADEGFVREFCESRGIRLLVERADVPSIAESPGISLEMAARNARFEFFKRITRDNNCDTVALGHNADDRVELLLMRLLRGSGGHGLGSLRPVKKIDDIIIIRPLLSITRAEILDFLGERGIPYRTDSTNLDLTTDRGKVRNTILPELIAVAEKLGYSGIKEALARSSELISDDEDFIDSELGKIGSSFYAKKDDGLFINLGTLRNYHPAITGRLLLGAFQEIFPDIRLEKGHIDTLGRMIEGNARTANLPGDLRAEVEGDEIVIRDDRSATETPDAVTVSLDSLPAKVRFGIYDLEFNFYMVDFSRTQTGVESSHVRTFIQPPTGINALEIRSFRYGDRMSPMGMSGHMKKLSDIFIDRMVPRRMRRLEPIVSGVPGGEILALPGLKMVSERAKVLDEKKPSVEIRAEKR